MVKLLISAEVSGVTHICGCIETVSGEGERFTYDQSWIEEVGKPLSASLPLQSTPFASAQFRPYFEGLLPEGDYRVSIAKRLHVSPHSYLKLLSAVGSECIGALTLQTEGEDEVAPSYRPFNESDLLRLAESGYNESVDLAIESRLSIAGAQSKTGLYYAQADEKWYLPLASAPSTHIVKPCSARFDSLIENEAYCMSLARVSGVNVSETFILDNVPMLAAKRYDRFIARDSKTVDGLPTPYRLHQEDCCQALGIGSDEKYEGKDNAALVALLLRSISSDAANDLFAFWDMLVFNFLIGNCDAHLKNYSVLRSADWSGVRLAPAYDLVSTTVYGDLNRTLGMVIGGVSKIENLTRDSFSDEAKSMGMNPKMALKRADEICTRCIDGLSSVEQTVPDTGRIAGEIKERSRLFAAV